MNSTLFASEKIKIQKLFWLAVFSSCCVMLAFPLQAAAQVSISPSSYDFGEVEVGATSTVIFTITSSEPRYTFDFAGLNGSLDFHIIRSPTPGTEVSDSGLEIEVAYSPLEVGQDSGAMLVVVVDGLIFYLVVDLTGVGVEAGMDPLAEIQEILAFFDSSFTNGTLTGSGPGSSAQGRLRALRNMLEAVSDLIQNGEMATACQQLWDAYRRTDGRTPPPDFVQDDATQDLAHMILDLYEAVCVGRRKIKNQKSDGYILA